MTFLDSSWLPAPANLVLSRNEVHIWCASLDQLMLQAAQLEKTLSIDEQLRASRFHFEQHRQNFIICRGVLRAVLARYMDIKPSEVQFCYGSHGKPELADTNTASLLQFNLSHSHRVALYALAQARQVGIDVEHLRPLSEVEQIAKRFFCPREYAELSTFPLEQQQEAFFRYWTLKEAYIKATGQGLSLPLNQFEVSLVSDSTAAVRIPLDPQKALNWSLRELSFRSDYVASIAVEGDSFQLKCWQWLS